MPSDENLEWHAVPEIVTLNIQALHDLVKAQGEKLCAIEKAQQSRVVRSDFAAALTDKVSRRELDNLLEEQSRVVDDKADARDVSMVLERLRKEVRNALLASSDQVQENIKTKPSRDEVNTVLANLEGRLVEAEARLSALIDNMPPPPPLPLTVAERQAELRQLLSEQVDALKAELKRDVRSALDEKAEETAHAFEASVQELASISANAERRLGSRMEREAHATRRDIAAEVSETLSDQFGRAIWKLPTSRMSWAQATVVIEAPRRGCHLITQDILDGCPQLADFQLGMCFLFVQHTGCSLSVNVVDDPTVCDDMERALEKLVPRRWVHDGTFCHTIPASDRRHTMPAHVQAALMGGSLSLPVSRGTLALGEWQGVYLNDHGLLASRNSPRRSIIVTVQGELAERSRSGYFALYR